MAAARPPTFSEFFAGIGLVRAGLQRSGWRVAFANDIDLRKKEMYEANFGPAPHYSTEDVHRLAERPGELPRVDLAHASFPCTDLSLAGARRGIRQGQSSAFWGFHQTLASLGAKRPPLVLLENVVGFLSSHGGGDFAAALESLNDLGYTVDSFIVDAVHFVPQSRPRLFVAAIDSSCPLEALEHPWLAPSELVEDSLRPRRLIQAIQSNARLDWRLWQFPDPPRRTLQLADVIQDPPSDSKQWWSAERTDYLCDQMSERHRAVAEAMIAGDEWSYGTIFRRVRRGRSMAELRVDGVAGCLRTPKGGSGRQILFKAGRGRRRVRLLQPAECASLMGAPGFQIATTLNQALFGFGDAVCADVVDWIAQVYLNPLYRHLQETGTAL